MKKPLLHGLFLMACLFFSAEALSQIEPPNPTSCSGTFQVSNESSSSWTVNYYGVTATVLPTENIVFGFTNASLTAVRSIELTSNPTCIRVFPSTFDVWNATCAPGSPTVTYFATYPTGPGISGGAGSPGCLTRSVIEIE